MSELLKKLTKEKFNGNPPEWKEQTLVDIKVRRAEDEDNFYYNKNGFIYVKLKGEDNRLYCYGCGTEITIKRKRFSVQYRKFDSPGGKIDIKYKYIPYCPKCEEP